MPAGGFAIPNPQARRPDSDPTRKEQRIIHLSLSATQRDPSAAQREARDYCRFQTRPGLGRCAPFRP